MIDLKVITTDNEVAINHTKRMISQYRAWERQHIASFNQAMNNSSTGDLKDSPQEDIRKVVYAGVRRICTLDDIFRECERLGVDSTSTYEKTKEYFGFIDAVFTVMGYMTLKNFITTFPITKTYDGEKWSCKDYFYTVDVIKKMDMEVPIGRDQISELLWDYQNELLFQVYGQWMRTVDSMRRYQGEKTFAQEMLEEMNIPTHTVNEDKGFILNNQTGEVMNLTNKKSSHLKLVK